jgi:hypothetical protein
LQIPLKPGSLQWVVAKILNNNLTSYKWERDDALQLRDRMKRGETEAREAVRERERERDRIRSRVSQKEKRISSESSFFFGLN